MKINKNLSGIANLLAAINAANGSSITEDQVTVGDPGFLSWETAAINTAVILTGVNGKGIEGSRTFNYIRLSIAGPAVPSNAPTSFVVEPEDDVVTSGDKVIAALGLRPSEVTGGFYTAPSVGVPGSMNIYSNVTSLMYLGTRSVVLKFADPAVDFASVAPITDADGFDAEA